jgi:sugar-specific transcriptional regulator TrmB
MRLTGIKGTAARVYAELVQTDQLSAGQIAERCGISARQAATELRNIASLGLAFQVSGRPIRYRAVAPDLAISTLIAQRENELRDARATMHRLTEVFQETSRVAVGIAYRVIYDSAALAIPAG